MSTKAKNTTIEKTVSFFEKMDIDEKMKAFTQIREIMEKAIDEQTEAFVKFSESNLKK